MRLFIALMFVSFNLFANVEWNDLEVGNEYTLTQSFSLKQTGNTNSMLDIMKGEKLKLSEIVWLDMINVVVYEFEYKNCPGAQMTTEMEIIPVANTSVEVGAQLAENCTLEIYNEAKDIMSESFLK